MSQQKYTPRSQIRAVTWPVTLAICLFRFVCYWPLCAKMTLSTKPEVHSASQSQYHQKNTEIRPSVAFTENLMRLSRGIPETCLRTYIQSDRPIHHNTLLPHEAGVIMTDDGDDIKMHAEKFIYAQRTFHATRLFIVKRPRFECTQRCGVAIRLHTAVVCI